MNNGTRESKRGDYLTLATCLFGSFLFFAYSDFVYFRDYAITFEGAYRISIGQLPFRDFFMPIGPVSLVVPALFFKVFQPDWTIFLLAQQFENSVMLVLLYGLLRKLAVRAVITRVSLFVFAACYLLLLSHPWYNSTGVLIMFASAYFALFSSGWFALLSGLMAGLAVLTKQDFGLLTFLISGFLLSIVSLGSDLKVILPSRRFLSDKGKLRTLALRLGLYVSSAVAIVSLYIMTCDPVQFKFWFNYGQAPHELRSLKLHDVIGYPFGFLGWSMTILALARNNLKLLVTAIFILAATVSRTTSGLIFTHYYFMGFIPLLLDECWSTKIRWRTVFLFLLMYSCLRVASSPLRDSYSAIKATVLSQPLHYGFDQSANVLPMVNSPTNLKSFSPRTQMPQETVDLLFNLKDLAAEKRTRRGDNVPLEVLNLTELTPVYAELDAIPPKGIPLWFHTKVSLFPGQVNQLNLMLAQNTYDIVLLQGTHEGLTAPYLDFLSILKKNKSYALTHEIKNTPANATYPCMPNCQGQIFVFSRR